MASENFLQGVPVVDLEDFLTFEEIERERNRLLSLAPRMTIAEVRLAGARLADCLMQESRSMTARERALLQLRGQTAIEIFCRMAENEIRPSRMKRIMMASLGQSTEEQIVVEFTGVQLSTKTKEPKEQAKFQSRDLAFTAGCLSVVFVFMVLVVIALIIQNI